MITFEDGLYELCGKRIEEDTEYLQDTRLWDGKVNAEIFREYQDFQFQRTLRHVYENSRFYRKQWEEHQIHPEEIRDFGDLKKLPFTFPEDLRTTGYEFLCMSQRNIEKPVTFYSSGTTGIRKRMYFSKTDMTRIMHFIGTAMNTIAEADSSSILSLMTNSQGRGASELYAKSVRARGMKAYVADMAASSEEILNMSMEHGCNIWFGDVTTIYRIAKEMEQQVDLKKLGIELLYVTMGHISQPVRQYLKEAFGCRVIAHYGLTEVGWGFAIECGECGGYHYNELDVYTEVVDPDTGEQLPDGRVGELTYTIIGKEAMPLIRYRSGDLAYCKEAECGQGLRLIGPIQRRIEGAFSVEEETLIYPAMLEEVIYTIDEIVDYRPYINEGQLVLYVELCRENPDVKEELIRRLQTLPEMQKMKCPRVELLQSGMLRKFCYEKKHIQNVEKEAEIWQESFQEKLRM